jgi:hypothetical protein
MYNVQDFSVQNIAAQSGRNGPVTCRTGAGIDQLHSPKQICSKFVIDAG